MVVAALTVEFWLLLIPLLAVSVLLGVLILRYRREMKWQRREFAQLRETTLELWREVTGRHHLQIEVRHAISQATTQSILPLAVEAAKNVAVETIAEVVEGTAREVESSLHKRVDNVNSRVDGLRFESEKLSCLPLLHPARVELVEGVIPRLRPIQARLERVLFPGHEPLGELDWMYKLRTRKFPYSLTDEEGLILYKIVTELGLKAGYEIATAFGYSSFYLGLAFKRNQGSLLSLDAYVEEAEEDFLYDEQTAMMRAAAFEEVLRMGGEGLPEGLRFALKGAEELELVGTVRYEIGFSPSSVSRLLAGSVIDFAFIDGGHFGNQPVLDVDAVIPFLNQERCVIMFHDTNSESVAKAVFHAANAIGGVVSSINTRNRLVMVSRNIDTQIVEKCRAILSRQYC